MARRFKSNAQRRGMFARLTPRLRGTRRKPVNPQAWRRMLKEAAAAGGTVAGITLGAALARRGVSPIIPAAGLAGLLLSAHMRKLRQQRGKAGVKIGRRRR